MAKIEQKIKFFLDERKELNTLRKIRKLRISSSNHCEFRKKKLINFSSNDYLGLSKHPYMVSESLKWLEKFGTSFSASRLVCGTSAEVVEIEEKIAEWKATESSIIVGSGYLANCGAIPALAGRKTAIFADKLNHASLNVGCIQSGAEFNRYRHLDLEHLENLLRNSQAEEKLIVSDTIFSMDGDIAEIQKLYVLSEKYDAMLYLDDAHASGVFGKRGEGSSLDFVEDFSRMIVMGTFSKGMGAYGAYIAGTRNNIDYLVNTCGSFIYSTALPPSAYGAINASIDLVQKKELRQAAKNLLQNSAELLSELEKHKFDCGNSESQIIPIIIGDSAKTIRFTERLIEKGILAVPIRPPTVPQNSSRIRISLNTAHSKEDIKTLSSKLICLFHEISAA
ncbi:MAG TPA: 8-amino-7-oxononanoate synthase [Victivallales bacterium]|nr:8-amino-7-oxononanoate synthase [Victivallales bacterium]